MAATARMSASVITIVGGRMLPPRYRAIGAESAGRMLPPL
jgi:hypothetical protein